MMWGEIPIDTFLDALRLGCQLNKLKLRVKVRVTCYVDVTLSASEPHTDEAS